MKYNFSDSLIESIDLDEAKKKKRKKSIKTKKRKSTKRRNSPSIYDSRTTRYYGMPFRPLMPLMPPPIRPGFGPGCGGMTPPPPPPGALGMGSMHGPCGHPVGITESLLDADINVYHKVIKILKAPQLQSFFKEIVALDVENTIYDVSQSPDTTSSSAESNIDVEMDLFITREFDSTFWGDIDEASDTDIAAAVEEDAESISKIFDRLAQKEAAPHLPLDLGSFILTDINLVDYDMYDDSELTDIKIHGHSRPEPDVGIESASYEISGKIDTPIEAYLTFTIIDK